MFAMSFLGSLIWYSVLFIFMIAVATAGIFTGKKLRDRKDAKAAAADGDKNQK